MKKNMTRLIAALGLCFLGSVVAIASPTSQQQIFDFTVFLDGDPVGQHVFRVESSKAEKSVHSEAAFSVKFLMINAYRYQHQANETWEDNCLTSLKASTQDNGTDSVVEGKTNGTGFLLKRELVQEMLPSCIMTFAYWNPDMLKQSRLLNPQTGEYVDVEITPKGRDRVEVKGNKTTANRYHLKTRQFDMELWYADNGDWIALDSRLEGGHILKYRLEGLKKP